VRKHPWKAGNDAPKINASFPNMMLFDVSDRPHLTYPVVMKMVYGVQSEHTLTSTTGVH
jgi:hypothetical protein